MQFLRLFSHGLRPLNIHSSRLFASHSLCTAFPIRGDKVSVNLLLKFPSGEVYDAPDFEGGETTFLLGDGEMLPAVETQLFSMKAGEKADFVVPSEQAFGPRRQQMILQIPQRDLELSYVSRLSPP
jgi:FKBP-type peptidyl-prolyl cis-trans isomerase 2